ncbi:MAG: protoglobin domain-containing protein, partial [Micromonosporaceae bacterium]
MTVPASGATTIPGYTYGTADVARSPVTDDDLATLLSTLLWTDADERALRQAGDVLAGQEEAVLDVWYGYVASQPHLVAYFAGP